MNSLQGVTSSTQDEDREYDFQELLKLVSSADLFPVDFERAWTWSGFSNKYKARKILIKSFDEREDFSIRIAPLQQLHSSRQGSSGNPMIIKISIECWKSLALMSNTLKGRQLRRDILQCEAMVKRKGVRNSSELSAHLKKAVQKNVALQEILSHQWCNSLLKMKLAAELLKYSTIEDVRNTYIEILASSCQELLKISNSVADLHLLSDFENFQALQELSASQQLLTA